VQRKYKIDLSKKRNLLPGEIPHVEDTAIVLRLAGYNPNQISR
jgi:hypothetical protein